MDAIPYDALALAESALGVFGVRALYEQPRYAVVERLARGVEIRAYDARLAVETDARGRGDGAAFGRLFRYIAGANRGGARIAMTAPVEVGRATTAPPEARAGGVMRFYLPRAVAADGPPEPSDAAVRLVRVPAERVAALRYAGSVGPRVQAAQEGVLRAVLAAAGRGVEGPAVFMGYDPPFALPFLRRNEVAVRLPPD